MADGQPMAGGAIAVELLEVLQIDQYGECQQVDYSKVTFESATLRTLFNAALSLRDTLLTLVSHTEELRQECGEHEDTVRFCLELIKYKHVASSQILATLNTQDVSERVLGWSVYNATEFLRDGVRESTLMQAMSTWSNAREELLKVCDFTAICNSCIEDMESYIYNTIVDPINK